MANQLTNPLSGRGTAGTIPVWSTPTTIGNSRLSQSGTIVTNTGIFEVADGSTGAPAYSFTGSSGTGMSRGTSGTILRFSASGGFAFGVSSSQQVLIGGTATMTPLGPLDVRDSALSGLGVASIYTGTITAGQGGAVTFGGYFTGTSPTTWSKIVGGKDNATAGDFGGHLQFLTRPNGGSLVERMRIDSTGNAGLGTPNPYGTGPGLHIERAGGTTSYAEYLRLRNTTFANNSNTSIGFYVSSNTVPTGVISHVYSSTLATYDTVIAGWNGTALAEFVRIQGPNGNVSFGTSPTAGRSLTTAADIDVFGVRVGRGAGAQANNVALGNLALDTNTTGANTTALGSQALRYSTGNQNTAIGSGASFNNTTGFNNTSVGWQAGWGVTTGTQNVSVGANAALYQNGTSNTAVGYESLLGALSVSTGTGNTAVGSQSLRGNTTGSRNTAVGEAALYQQTAASDCTAVGRYAQVYSAGIRNTAVGSQAMQGVSGSTTGANNVAVGFQSAQGITTGGNNTYLGVFSGLNCSTASNNTFVGYATASGGALTGGDNTLIGAVAGNQITTGANNVCVGSNAGQTQTTASNNTWIGKNSGYFFTGGSNTAVGRGAMTGVSGSSTGVNNVAIGQSAGGGLTTGSGNIILGVDANAATPTTNNTFVLGSAGNFVATNGGPTTYYATAGASLGYIQIRLNGADVKIQVFAP
jgi:hypothetical protein